MWFDLNQEFTMCFSIFKLYGAVFSAHTGSSNTGFPQLLTLVCTISYHERTTTKMERQVT